MRKIYLHKRFYSFLQKIKRSVIIEKTVSNNIKKKLIIMMLSMMFSHTIFICLPQRFRIESN
jgi:hypothetical protein